MNNQEKPYGTARHDIKKGDEISIPLSGISNDIKFFPHQKKRIINDFMENNW